MELLNLLAAYRTKLQLLALLDKTLMFRSSPVIRKFQSKVNDKSDSPCKSIVLLTIIIVIASTVRLIVIRTRNYIHGADPSCRDKENTSYHSWREAQP